MAFMYLHLSTNRDGRVLAEVLNHGALKFSNLGGPNSKQSNLPFAVFAIDEFTGLGAIEDSQLLDELFNRYSTKEIAAKIGYETSNEDLMEQLRRRLDKA